MSDNFLASLTLAELCELFEKAGYRVEPAVDPASGVSYLRSTASGIAFDLRPGARSPGDSAGRFVDFTLVCVLRCRGEAPGDLVNDWNITHRFSRLQFGGSYFALCMDVSIFGGVTREHFRTNIEIWGRLVEELIVHLREGVRERAAARRAESDRAEFDPDVRRHESAVGAMSYA
jgi:hypothetical protein